MMKSPPSLKVLTLNCWGLKLVSKDRKPRLNAIANFLSTSSSSSFHSEDFKKVEGFDFIALQEIWCREDYELVAEKAKLGGLYYSKFFYSGAVGSGLAILSHHPILSSFIQPYSLSGYPLHFIEGDFFAAKAVCGISIEVEGIGKIEVLNTHLYAPGGEADGLEGSHRVGQVWELSKIIRNSSERGSYVVLMGDLNTQPQSNLMNDLLSGSNLIDSFSQTHDLPPELGSEQHLRMSPIESLHAFGITCDSPLNTYSAPKLAKKSLDDEIIVRGGKRLDYILYSSPSTANTRLAANSLDLLLVHPIIGQNFSYSDHFGLESILTLLPIEATTTLSGRPILSPPNPISHSAISKSLSILSNSFSHSIQSSRSQLKLLLLNVILVPVLAIAASFQPLQFLAWIFVLLGIANGAVGATMLYSGFVGGRWEAGSLKNIIGEMEDSLIRLEEKGENRNRNSGLL